MNATEIAAVERAQKMEDEFQSWAGTHGGLRLTPADRAATLLSQTYLIWETELAWRAWANSRNAIAPPVAAGSVDTPAFRLKLPMSLPDHGDKWQELVSYIDAHVAQLVADALAGQMAVFKKAGDVDLAEFNRKWTEQKQRAEKAEARTASDSERISYLEHYEYHERMARQKAEADASQWKANHADMVKRCALLRERDDLPVDRLPAYRELVALQEAALAQVVGGQAPVLRMRDPISMANSLILEWDEAPQDADDWGNRAAMHMDVMAKALMQAWLGSTPFATPQPAPVAGPVDERAAFESWMREECGADDDMLKRPFEDRYFWARAADMCGAWQARATLATPPAISTSKGAPADPQTGGA